jgi:hypothetical protein
MKDYTNQNTIEIRDIKTNEKVKKFVLDLLAIVNFFMIVNKNINKHVKNVSLKHKLKFEYFSGKGQIFSSAHV